MWSRISSSLLLGGELAAQPGLLPQPGSKAFLHLRGERHQLVLLVEGVADEGDDVRQRFPHSQLADKSGCGVILVEPEKIRRWEASRPLGERCRNLGNRYPHQVIHAVFVARERFRMVVRPGGCARQTARLATAGDVFPDIVVPETM